jgi:hypothetical protein
VGETLIAYAIAVGELERLEGKNNASPASKTRNAIKKAS